MAYAAGDFRLQVIGSTIGGEIWVNTWSFRDQLATQDPQDVVDILHDLYEDLFGFATHVSDNVDAVRCTIKDMVSGLTSEGTWATITGASASDPLPGQLALRVSLAAGSVRGGPFLPGYTINVLNADGDMETAIIGDIVTALTTFTSALAAADWDLAIDRPTVPSMVAVTAGRIGRRLDVIRRRANEIAEGYTTFPV